MKLTLEVDAAALRAVREDIVKSEIGDPVVCLIEYSGPHHISGEIRSALIEGADENAIRLITQAFASGSLNQSRRLKPAIYAKRQAIRGIRTEVDGITFSVPGRVVRSCNLLKLQLEDGVFILRDAVGNVVMPSREPAAQD